MAILTESWSKIKRGHKTWALALMLVLLGALSFGLGRLSGLQAGREDIGIDNLGPAAVSLSLEKEKIVIPPPGAGEAPSSAPISQQYVGSRSSDKYHLPWCSGAKRIKQENLIYFASIADAEQAGYKPAGNCPGLK
ncbi:MAG: Ada metal-binding domain-containing protein [Patescibacteria group bacterium]|nr:Ada metal-binding domain-containing protein [Patescibacteria group bacterium]